MSIESNSNTKTEDTIDYEELIPSQCDTNIKFSNPYEEKLIKRIYVRVANLCSYLAGYKPIDLKFYLNQPNQYKFMPLYYAIKVSFITFLLPFFFKMKNLVKAFTVIKTCHFWA